MTAAAAATESATRVRLPARRRLAQAARRNRRTSGATAKLKMTASVIGTRTSRPKYKSASIVPVATMPLA